MAAGHRNRTADVHPSVDIRTVAAVFLAITAGRLYLTADVQRSADIHTVSAIFRAIAAGRFYTGIFSNDAFTADKHAIAATTHTISAGRTNTGFFGNEAFTADKHAIATINRTIAARGCHRAFHLRIFISINSIARVFSAFAMRVTRLGNHNYILANVQRINDQTGASLSVAIFAQHITISAQRRQRTLFSLNRQGPRQNTCTATVSIRRRCALRRHLSAIHQIDRNIAS